MKPITSRAAYLRTVKPAMPPYLARREQKAIALGVLECLVKAGQVDVHPDDFSTLGKISDAMSICFDTATACHIESGVAGFLAKERKSVVTPEIVEAARRNIDYVLDQYTDEVADRLRPLFTPPTNNKEI